MKTNDMIDHHLYEVRLIVAIPNYGIATTSAAARYTALDAIVPQLGEDVIVLGMHEQELTLANVPQTTALITPTAITSTAVATTNVVDAPRKSRTVVDVPNGHQRWTKAERKELLHLSYQGKSNAEIGKKLGRTEKAVAQQLWYMEKGE